MGMFAFVLYAGNPERDGRVGSGSFSDHQLMIRAEGGYQFSGTYMFSSDIETGFSNGASYSLSADVYAFQESRFFIRLLLSQMRGNIVNVVEDEHKASALMMGLGVGRRSNFIFDKVSSWWALEGGPVQIKSKDKIDGKYLTMKHRPFISLSVGMDYSLGKHSALGVYARDVVIGDGYFDNGMNKVSCCPLQIGVVYTLGIF